MKPLFFVAAAVLAACTFPPMNPPKQEEIPVSPAIEITAPKETPKVKEQQPSYPKIAPAHPCIGIQTGDPKDDVRAKLDCLHQHG